MNELNIKLIFLKVNQAVYTKVLNALFKMEAEEFEIFKKVIPGMGGLHIGICILRTFTNSLTNAVSLNCFCSRSWGGRYD